MMSMANGGGGGGKSSLSLDDESWASLSSMFLPKRSDSDFTQFANSSWCVDEFGRDLDRVLKLGVAGSLLRFGSWYFLSSFLIELLRLGGGGGGTFFGFVAVGGAKPCSAEA